MNLQHLSNKDFETSFHQVVKSERKIMHIVLQHIQEAERRKLYLAKGFSSLFDYLTKELKYSGSSAQRRIQGARMLTAVPSVAEKLETGALNLSQVAELQRASREAEKIHDVKVTSETKAEILEGLIGKNTSETQQAVANALNIPTNDGERITTQKDNSKRFQGMFTEEQFRKFEEVRDFLAHKNFKAKRTQRMSDVFETMFDEILKQKKVNQTAKEAGLSQKAASNGYDIKAATTCFANGSLDIYSNGSIEISAYRSQDSSSISSLDTYSNSSIEKSSHRTQDMCSNNSVGVVSSRLDDMSSNKSSEIGSNRPLQRLNGQCGRGVPTKNDIEVQFETFPRAQCPTEAEFDAVAYSHQIENRIIETKNAEAAVKCGTETTWNSLTPKRKKIILELDQCCQYEDFETGKICGSTFNLEVDHITPRHQGGTNDLMNLRVLCRAHNQFRNSSR